KSHHRKVLQQIAGLFALVFAVFAVSASLHHHDGNVKSTGVVASLMSALPVNLDANTISVATHLPDTASSTVGCGHCDWMATTVRLTPPVSSFASTTFSRVAPLRLTVRLASLCAIAAPRRGLRAPPAFQHA
ncbi:MAG: hypothetical protein H7Y38_09155, partial [Armatimonadetes bacterium]|nr:hypothetical protein [Armatimonadota bacterium]